MKNYYFKIICFGLCCSIWTGSLDAEILRINTIKQDSITPNEFSSRTPAKQKPTINNWKQQRIKKSVKLLIQKRKDPEGQRDLLILGNVLLVIGAILFGLYSIAFVILTIVFGIPEMVFVYILVMLLLFGLTGLCIRGIVNNSRKLRQMKNGETTPAEKFPRRPPSKNLKTTH